MGEIEIRNAPASLKDHIKDICRETFTEHRARQPYAFPENFFDAIMVHRIERAFKTEKGNPLSESPVIFAAYIQDEFAGYIILSDWARPNGVDMPYVNIDDIHVVPKFRGQKVGEALLKHVKSLADEHNWDNMSATIWHGNESSAALFREAGFTPQSTALRYGPDRQAKDYPDMTTAPTMRNIAYQWVYPILLVILALIILRY